MPCKRVLYKWTRYDTQFCSNDKAVHIINVTRRYSPLIYFKRNVDIIAMYWTDCFSTIIYFFRLFTHVQQDVSGTFRQNSFDNRYHLCRTFGYIVFMWMFCACNIYVQAFVICVVHVETYCRNWPQILSMCGSMGDTHAFIDKYQVESVSFRVPGYRS